MRRTSILALMLLPACSGAPQRSAPGGSSCTGDRTVIVNNRSNRDADVVAERRGGGAPIELGTVPLGRQQEISLPSDATTAHVRAPRESGTPVRGIVDLRYGCRQ